MRKPVGAEAFEAWAPSAPGMVREVCAMLNAYDEWRRYDRPGNEVAVAWGAFATRLESLRALAARPAPEAKGGDYGRD